MSPTLFVEILPSILFLLVSNMYNLIYGVATLIVSSFICICYLYITQRKISWILIFSFTLLAFFGGLTIYSGDGMFIKMKPTFVNCIFALTLFADSLILKKGFMKKLLGQSIQWSDRVFFKFSKHLGLFFLCVAALNELVWRNYSESTWIYFKVFALPILNISFVALYIGYVNQKEKISF